MAKTMTLRLDDEQAEQLETLAQVDEISISEAARRAIEDRIERRRKDKSFQTRLRKILEQNQRALERLAQ